MLIKKSFTFSFSARTMHVYDMLQDKYGSIQTPIRISEYICNAIEFYEKHKDNISQHDSPISTNDLINSSEFQKAVELIIAKNVVDGAKETSIIETTGDYISADDYMSEMVTDDDLEND